MSPCIRSRLVVLAVLGLGGCGSMIEPLEPGTGTGTSTSTSATASSTSDDGPGEASTSPADGPTTADAPSSTDEDDGGYEDDDGGTGCTFTCPDPPPPTPPPGGGGGGGGGFLECDLAAQDCPVGEKCMPWANDGGFEWNGTRCSPIAGDPGQAGEPCLAEGSPTSGIDDCDLGLVCWQVVPSTLQGMCHPLCDLEDDAYTCDAPLTCLELDLAPLCIQPCAPLDSASCLPGTACTFATSTTFVCGPAGAATLGTPCDPAAPCEAGTLCSYDAALDCGNGAGQGCCATPCDVNDPVACMGPEVCLPWFPLRPPPELAYLGVCAAP